MSLQISNAAKAQQLREYFARHGRIYIVVNATADGVDVPGHLRGDPALRLVLNVRMPQSIQIRDDALVSEFSFSGRPYPCHIPMHAIWAAYVPEREAESGIIWEEDVPQSIHTVVKAARRAATGDTRNGTPTPTGDTPANSKAVPAKKRVRHLRVVK